MIDVQRGRGAETQAEGKQALCREPDGGLDPGTPGLCPGPKAGTKLLSHPGIPQSGLLENVIQIISLYAQSPPKASYCS